MGAQNGTERRRRIVIGRSLKVANVIEEGRVGGPQLRSARLAASMASAIETVIILPTHESGRFTKLLADSYVCHHTLPLARFGRDPKTLARYLLTFPFQLFGLYEYIRHGSFDLVHASGGAWQWKAAIAAKLAGVKLVWHLNDTHMPLAVRMTFRCLSGLANAYIYSSERTRSYYHKLVSSRPGFIVPQPVDTAYFCPGLSTNREPRRLSLRRPIVGTVANVNHGKGLEYFVDVAKAVGDQVPNVQFQVVGPVYSSQVRYYERLQSRIRNRRVNNIAFLGPMRDVRPFLESLSVFVCTSLYESGPMTVFEAMSMAKPVVSTDVGDLRSFIRRGVNGEIVRVGDVEHMASCVSLLLLDVNRAKLYGDKARQVVQNRLSVSRVARIQEHVYRFVTSTSEA